MDLIIILHMDQIFIFTPLEYNRKRLKFVCYEILLSSYVYRL